MATPAESLVRRPHVVQTLSESFAVIGNQKHILAVRNGAKFRGIFLIFGWQTLFLRQIFVTIRQTFGAMACFVAAHEVCIASRNAGQPMRHVCSALPCVAHEVDHAHNDAIPGVVPYAAASSAHLPSADDHPYLSPRPARGVTCQ
jgi:hypothetical protein